MAEKLDTKSPLMSPADAAKSVRAESVHELSQYDSYDDAQSVAWDQFSSIGGARNQEAFYKSLSPKYQEKTVSRVAKFYYVWCLILLIQWYSFFFLQKQVNACPYNAPYCNKVNSNGALLFFYLVSCVYLSIQAL